MSATKKEDGMFLNETKMLVRNDKIQKKNKNLEQITSNSTPENDKITNANKIENSLWLLNDRIGQRAEHPSGDFIPKSNFNPEQEELLREYNEQYPDSFESTDVNGNKVVRPFLLPEVDLNIDLDYSNYDYVIDVFNSRKERLVELRGQIAKNIADREKRLITFTRIFNENKGNVIWKQKNKAQQIIEETTRNIEREQENIKKEKYKFDIVNREIDFYNQKLDEVIRDKGVVKNENQAKLKEYTDVFNSLNRGRFSTVQEPNETDEDYLERLKRNAEIEQPKQKLEDIVFMVSKKFKELLKELGIRNNSTIETVSNSLGDLTKSDILKKRGLFKEKFIKLFGENNKDIKPIDILNFINELGDIRHTKNVDLFTPANEPVQLLDVSDPYVKIKNKSSDLQELEQLKKQSNYFDEPENEHDFVNNLEIHDKKLRRAFNKLQDNRNREKENRYRKSKRVHFNEDENNYHLFTPEKDYEVDEEEVIPPSPIITEKHSITPWQPFEFDYTENNELKRGYVLIYEKENPVRNSFYLLISKTGQKDSFTQFKSSDANARPSEFINGLYQATNTTNYNQCVNYLKYEPQIIIDESRTFQKYKEHKGFGIADELKSNKYAALGKHEINLKSLYYRNFFKLYEKSGKNIGHGVYVSDLFVKLIMELLKGKSPDSTHLNLLPQNELHLFNWMLQKCGLKHINPAFSSTIIINNLKRRLELLEGEIKIGNNNPEVLKEIKTILKQLNDFGVISQSKIHNYLSQFEKY